jgi:hypothetical protein
MRLPKSAALCRVLHTAAAISGTTALVALSACDLPTSAPIIEQRWIVPGASSRITVADLLPAGVGVLQDSSGFSLAASLATFIRPLSDDCARCVATNGSTSVKPALVVNGSMSSLLPADVFAATLTAGTMAVTVTNNYTFDPLRPNGNVAPFGSAVITVSNGTTTLGSTTLSGASQSLAPNGGTLSATVPLTGNVSGGAPVSVSVSLNSPEGTPVAMDASRTLLVNAMPTGLRVARALVAVAGHRMSATSTLDFHDVPDAIAKRASKGALLLSIDNPFALTSALSISLMPDGGNAITKAVPLGTGMTSRSVDFTLDELKQLLGHSVTVTVSGVATPSTGAIAISPKQAVVVSTHFDLTLSVGN